MQPDDWFYNFCGNVGAVSAQHLIVERIFNLATEFSAATLFARLVRGNVGSLCPMICRQQPLAKPSIKAWRCCEVFVI